MLVFVSETGVGPARTDSGARSRAAKYVEVRILRCSKVMDDWVMVRMFPGIYIKVVYSSVVSQWQECGIEDVVDRYPGRIRHLIYCGSQDPASIF